MLLLSELVEGTNNRNIDAGCCISETGRRLSQPHAVSMLGIILFFSGFRDLGKMGFELES